MSISAVRLCDGCEKPAEEHRGEDGACPKSMRCAACKGVSYFAIACQKAHWQEHKPYCQKVQALLQNLKQQKAPNYQYPAVFKSLMDTICRDAMQKGRPKGELERLFVYAHEIKRIHGGGESLAKGQVSVVRYMKGGELLINEFFRQNVGAASPKIAEEAKEKIAIMIANQGPRQDEIFMLLAAMFRNSPSIPRVWFEGFTAFCIENPRFNELAKMTWEAQDKPAAKK